jgi:hypothetical protein
MVVPAGRRPTEPQDQQGSTGSPRHATSQLVQTSPTQWEGSTLATREGLVDGRSRSGWSRDASPAVRSGFLGVDQSAMRGTVAKARALLGDPGPGPVSCVRRPTGAKRTTHPIQAA